MDEKIQELLNRKPSKWGNVSIKTFQNDIRLLQQTVVLQDEKIKEYERERDNG